MNEGKPKNNAAELLKQIARIKGIDQSDIAKKCGISRITVNRFFMGHLEVRATDFINICGAVGIDLLSPISEAMEGAVSGIVQR